MGKMYEKTAPNANLTRRIVLVLETEAETRYGIEGAHGSSVGVSISTLQS
jgi:hypothetical protein